MRRSTALAPFLMPMAACAAAAQPCTPEWLPSPGLPGVAGVTSSGFVGDVMEWDPDGTGPQPPLRVIAGGFGVAGDTVTHNIATWDGVAWRALGTGLGYPGGLFSGGVGALEIYQGELIAGGRFYATPGQPASHIARWDGTSWQPLGSGTGEGVSDLLVHNGDLVAGGTFTAAGGGPGNAIARWDGASWHALGSGMNGPPSSEDDVYALASFGGDLIAAGSFDIAGGLQCNAIARWDGTSWHPLGTGITSQYGYVLALAEYNAELIVAGRFTSAGNVPASNIARWNGTTWQPLGSGIEYNEVNALCVYDGELIAGGLFSSAGGHPVNNIARWNGSTWQAPGPGVAGGILGHVYALGALSEGLYVGGVFETAGDTWGKSIARWDGEHWHSLGDTTGVNNAILTMTEHEGDLIAAGRFYLAGGSGAKIARWDGASWQPLTPWLSLDWIHALETYRGELVVGAGYSAPHLASWNGTSWSTLGNDPNGTVHALTVYDDRLIAGGTFAAPGWGIAAWDGAAWSPLGAGLSAPYWQFPSIQIPGFAYALTVYQGDLIAGGQFEDAGSADASNIARWDGASWHALGTGIVGASYYPVLALAVYRGDLIAAGSIYQAGGMIVKNIARWDGATWWPMGTGLQGCQGSGCTTEVRALTIHHGHLIAGGTFLTAGGVTAPRIARWDGAAWHPFGSGIGVPFDHQGVSALRSHKGALFAGGWFFTAGGNVSPYWARWGCDCYPDCDGSASLALADFGCFQTKFVAQDPYADCNQDAAFTVADFGCFQTRFVAGCP